VFQKVPRLHELLIKQSSGFGYVSF